MLILTIRTDKPEAEIGLYEDGERLAYETWQAHRELGRSMHVKLAELLGSEDKDLPDIQAIIGYKGPGSFTGLRIGLTVANTLAAQLPCPIVGTTGYEWVQQGVEKLLQGDDDKQVLPEYGAEANITTPRH